VNLCHNVEVGKGISDVKRVVQVLLVKVHLSVNVLAKVVGDLLDVAWAGSVGRLWTEVEPKAKQGMLVLWRLQVRAEIVTG
jgi:hypothetical protein